MAGIGFLLTGLLYPQLIFEPAFVFPGERFALRWEEHVRGQEASFKFTGSENVSLWKEGEVLYGIVKSPAPARFWLWAFRGTSVEDVTEVSVPVALCPKPRDPLTPSPQGPWFLRGEERWVALVPLENNYGLWIHKRGEEYRLAPVVALFLGARYAPLREREIRKNYLYGGARHVTLLASVSDLARLTLVVEPTRVFASLTARYDLQGEWRLLGKKFDVRLSPGETMRAEVPLP
ncbi:MAG: hypothetical protein K6T17_00005 [Fimbriimonadales bacterium]|nr:hypothetical protein [Fimbriimonadales bacterium]